MFKSAPRTAGRSTQGGFTLIELVVVIVILGILAAFAVPRFASVDRQARIASLRSLEGALRSSAMLTHSLWLAMGTNPANVTVDGNQVINMVNGYPVATTANGIAQTLQQGSVVANNDTTAGRYRTSVSGTALQFRLNGARDALTCFVSYTPPTAANNNPNIVVTPTGC